MNHEILYKIHNETLYQITAPHFCAGIIVENNVIIKAAPILRWMTDKDIGFIKEYCKKKKWTVYKVGN